MNTAKIGRMADKIADSAQRMLSYANDASSAVDSLEFFGADSSFFGKKNNEVKTAIAKMSAELDELTELIEAIEAASQ